MIMIAEGIWSSLTDRITPVDLPVDLDALSDTYLCLH